MSVAAHTRLQHEAFVSQTDPFRTELLAMCYRLLGSIQDAEDLLQETLLRAWRSYPDFDIRRGSMRTWLYQIATNACLNALQHSSRRTLPSGIAAPGESPTAPLLEAPPEVHWLEPLPAAFTPVTDPASIVGVRDSVRLAFIVALQHLGPRQRVVLLLRDVLAWRAAEVARLLGTTTAAVNSTLQRARARLSEVAPVEDDVLEPTEPRSKELLHRYVSAFERSDIDALMRTLREDAVLEMPPYLTWFRGRELIEPFLSTVALAAPNVWRTLPTTANGQPALGVYKRDTADVLRAHSLQVLTITERGISHLVAFQNPGLLDRFGMPPMLEPAW